MNIYQYDELQNKFSSVKILVIGDVMLDRYFYGEVNRISPEAPIPIVNITKRTFAPGGAGNVSANIAEYCVNTSLYGIIGEDESSDILLKIVSENGVKFLGQSDSKVITTTKTRVIGKHQQIVRFDEEKIMDLSHFISRDVIRNLIDVTGCNLIVLSDYNKGLLFKHACNNVIDAAHEAKIPVFVDPKNHNWDKYRGAFLIKPNYKEFCDAAGGVIDISNDYDELIVTARNLINKYNIENIIISLSEHGMIFVNHDTSFNYTSKAREVLDVSGAGDTVIATLSAFFAAGFSLSQSAKIANIAAGIAVEHLGTSKVSLKELLLSMENHENPDKSTPTRNKTITRAKLLEHLNQWRQDSKKTVFTNGCFDILHPGHIRYLEQSRLNGDILIVGLNSDDSVRRNKGKSRPVNNFNFRAEMLSALSCIDVVVEFDDDTPLELIRLIEPDVLVKGGDYAIEDIVGREFAKRTVTIPFIKGFSTSEVIEKCQKNGLSKN